MKYEIIQPPFYLDFENLSKQELKAYKEWFLNVMPERIEILINAVHSTQDFESWRADYSPESLDQLCEWFGQVVEVRPCTEEEKREYNKLMVGFNYEDPGWRLNNKTLSLCFDVGLYVGRVFFKKYPHLTWKQYLGSKRSLDYGQLVVIGLGVVPFNPLQVMTVLASGLIKKTRTGKRLREIYEIWAEEAKSFSNV